MANKTKTPKKDRFSKARGGNSQFLNIGCGKCNTHILTYQKDGKGTLVRLYLDRIFEPEELSKLQKLTKKSDIPNLVCKECNQLIGTPMIYESENRLAFRLVPGSFTKKKEK